MNPNEWIAGPDTGISSVTIWRHMMGLPKSREWHTDGVPLDPDDFGRCYRLLVAVPEWLPRVGEMAVYAEWAPLVGAWDELTALYERDIDRSGPHHRGRSDALYGRMQTLVDEGRALRKAR